MKIVAVGFIRPKSMCDKSHRYISPKKERQKSIFEKLKCLNLKRISL